MFFTTNEISSSHSFVVHCFFLLQVSKIMKRAGPLPYGTILYILPHNGKQLLNPNLCCPVFCYAILPYPFYYLANFHCLKEAFHNLLFFSSLWWTFVNSRYIGSTISCQYSCYNHSSRNAAGQWGRIALYRRSADSLPKSSV